MFGTIESISCSQKPQPNVTDVCELMFGEWELTCWLKQKYLADSKFGRKKKQTLNMILVCYSTNQTMLFIINKLKYVYIVYIFDFVSIDPQRNGMVNRFAPF